MKKNACVGTSELITLNCLFAELARLQMEKTREESTSKALKVSLCLVVFIWTNQFGEPGILSAPKLTNSYSRSSMST